MRDPIRQKELLDLIEAIWKKYPDIRLTQLILNCDTGLEFGMYYIDDDILYKKLCETYPL